MTTPLVLRSLFFAGPKREDECDKKVNEVKSMGFDEVGLLHSRIIYNIIHV